VEALWQFPASERRSLIQSAALVLQQRQIVQRIVDGALAFIAAHVHAYHLASAGDLDTIGVFWIYATSNKDRC
jgi:hypothetical protein